MSETDLQDLIELSQEFIKHAKDENGATQPHELDTSPSGPTKIYLMGVPNPGNQVRSVFIHTNDHKIGEIKFQTIALNGAEYTDVHPQHAEQWLRNSSCLLKTVKAFLGSLPASLKFYQMRVKLGSFVFDRWQHTNDAYTGYSDEEFQRMLAHENSEGHLKFRSDIKQITLDRISNNRTLFMVENSPHQGSTIRYAVEVEFQPKNGTQLQLELDFRLAGRRYEQFKSQWMDVTTARHFVRNKPLLQAVMLNPERADWELSIREKAVLDPSEVTTSMHQFQHTVRLHDGVIDEPITAKAKRRTIMPDGFQISRLVERATMRIPIKGTDYVLEIVRYDTYYPQPMKQKQSIAPDSDMYFKAPLSCWEAIIVGENWDDDMRDVGKLTADSNMNIESIFDQFFKRRRDEPQMAAFQRFLQIVTDVAEVWDQTGSYSTSHVSESIPGMHSATTTMEGQLIEL